MVIEGNSLDILFAEMPALAHHQYHGREEEGLE